MTRIWILAAFAIWIGAPQEAPDRVENWQVDLDELAKALSQRHKHAFFKISRDEFFRAVDGVRKRIPELKDHQIAVEFMKLAALIGDGHTSVKPSSLRRYPISALWCRDGLFIAAASEEHKDLLKMRIVAVGKIRVEDAAGRVAAVAAADNASGARHASAYWLTIAEVLAGVGLADDAERAEFTVVDAKKKQRTVLLAPAVEPVRRQYGFDMPAKDLPMSRSLMRPWYGLQRLRENKGFYVWYDSCADSKDRTVASWCHEVLEAIDKEMPERVIFDLRRNGGGNSTLLQPLIAGLRKRTEATAPGKLFVLVDRSTYSSAILNALELRREFKAILVGLPPGGSPNHYGEVRFFTLPNSQWQVQYSTKYFKPVAEEGDTIKPDVEVEWTSAEFFGGKDPALEVAIKHP
jgi:hypothetical protein